MAKVTLWNRDKKREEKFEPVDASEILAGKNSCYCEPEEKSKAGRPATDGPTVSELKQKLADLGVKIPNNANKAKLLQLLEEANSDNESGDSEDG